MTEARTIKAVDLFCGAGGTSLGCVVAAKKIGYRLDLLAINHWDVAIATHEKNLPGVRHLCADVEAVRPDDVVAGHHLDLLVASPTCTHFSSARGGRPINDQKRADPWQVVRWASELRIENILIENVPEFRSWGPIDGRGRPLKSRRGETFQTYLNTLRGLGYTVEARVLNAADYGDPTTRRRLFIIARRAKPIRWPEPTHAKPDTLAPGQKPWRAASEIIDWSIKGESIFGRKRGPLAKNTIARIIAGLQRFGGPQLEPFLVILRGTDPEQLRRSARPISLPLPAACASGTHMALAEPFLLSQQSGGAPRTTRHPVPTVASRGAIALIEPAFLVPRYGERKGQPPRTHSLSQPMPTVPATNQHMLVEPFLVHVNHGAKNSRGTNGALPRGEAAFVEQTGKAQGAQVEAVGLARAKGFLAQREAIGEGATALVNALAELRQGARFVPDVLVTGGNGGGGILDALGAALIRSFNGKESKAATKS